MASKITHFRLLDCGIERPCYFRVSIFETEGWDVWQIGVGNNLAEAIDDCLDQIAWNYGVDVEGMEERILKREGWEYLPTDPSCEHEDECYYVVLCFDVAKQGERKPVTGLNGA